MTFDFLETISLLECGRKIFAYGVRHSFGMAFDPIGGALWTEENGDDSFDEINRVDAGANNGWVQMMGPVARVSQFKSIETTLTPGDAVCRLALEWRRLRNFSRAVRRLRAIHQLDVTIERPPALPPIG
jgi:hypothetical protein